MLKIVGMGVCAGVLMLLLAIAYLPGFCMAGYEGLRDSNMIGFVPLITVVGIGSAVSWLYLKYKEDDLA